MAHPKVVRSVEELSAVPLSQPVQIEFAHGDNSQRVTLTTIDRKAAIETGLSPIALAESRLYPGACQHPRRKSGSLKRQSPALKPKRALKLLIAWAEQGGGADST